MSRPDAAVVVALAGVRGFSSDECDMVLDFLAQWRRSNARAAEELGPRVPVLAGREFTWPEFDRWQAFFAEADVFPARWDGLHAAPAPGTPAADTYQRRKLDLLFEWLDAVARRSPVLAHYARQGLVARVARQDTQRACAACVPFAGRPVTAASEVIPPFHPGCRCLLLAARPSGPRPRRRSYSRVYRQGS